MLHRVARFVIFAAVLCMQSPVRSADDKVSPEEKWDAVFMGTDKVGYMRTVTRPVQENGRELVQVQVEHVLSIKRFGQTAELKTEYVSVETPDGKLVRMDNRVMEQRTRGEVVGDKLKLTLDTRGKQTAKTIPWSDDILGPNAEDRILKKEAIKPGQKRTYRSFMPDANLVITSTLVGEELEEVALLDGSKKSLQRVRGEIIGVPGLENMKTYMWVDSSGETLKTHTDVPIPTTTYRVSKDVAMAKPSSVSGDFGVTTLVKSDKKIPKPYETSEVVYRISLKDGDAMKAFVHDERQKLSKSEQGEVLLTIHAVDPTRAAAEPRKTPDPEFLASNNYLQADDPKVIQLAKDATGDATDPWEQAKRIEKWVYQHITEKNFNNLLDTAAEVAQKLEGDCTEHGVLLAAMARVVGLPSRVAVGLVYADRLGKFGFHMWTEVFVNGQWVPVDGTLGMGHASPVHLKVFDSSMDGVDAQAAFFPVIRVMQGLKIEVVSWKHADGN